MLLFFARKNKDIKTQLIHKPSPEASFRLSKALSMLIDEKDILEHFQKCSKTKTNKLKTRISKPEGSLMAFITIDQDSLTPK